MKLTHGALFNGIAGFPLAAAWAGIETAWTVEIDEFCNKVSKKHFPNAIQYTDIRTAKHLPYVDIISGGFPCQPFSVAGKQLAQEDDRHLWPEMLRVIRETRPPYVIGENVTGIISLALDEVLASLEAEGYTTETFIVPAVGVGAPHRRDRVWIVAYSNSAEFRRVEQQRGWQNEEQEIILGSSGVAADTENNRSERQSWGCRDWEERGMVSQRIGSRGEPERSGETTPNPNSESGIFLPRYRGQSKEHPIHHDSIRPDFRLTESPVCGADDGVSTGLVRNRSKQLKAYGNAIVPQVAFEFFKAIIEMGKSKQIY